MAMAAFQVQDHFAEGNMTTTPVGGHKFAAFHLMINLRRTNKVNWCPVYRKFINTSYMSDHCGTRLFLTRWKIHTVLCVIFVQTERLDTTNFYC
ncbi:expressed protein [Echinococcus multilocularis]|uniref:Expressed protein n=1 Tax=Echinococcus multilocularis TaxID=6211 RepID=A0A087W1Y1_ECHMU|nr:expressed protein [Echinococcus multilocularis]